MEAEQQNVVDLDYAIGERVDTLRRRFGYSHDEFGAILGVGGSAVSLKLRGKRGWSAMDVKTSADVLGVRVAVLYGDEPMPEPTRPGLLRVLDTSKNSPVGPTGLEPMTSTV